MNGWQEQRAARLSSALSAESPRSRARGDIFGVQVIICRFFLAFWLLRSLEFFLAFHYLYSPLMDKRTTEVSHCKAQITTIIVDCVGMFNHTSVTWNVS